MNDLQVNNAVKIASLIVKQGQASLSPAEREELEQWLREDQDNTRLFDELTDEASLAKAMEELNVYDHEAACRKLSGKLVKHAPELTRQHPNRQLWRYIAGAVLLLVAGSILIYLISH